MGLNHQLVGIYPRKWSNTRWGRVPALPRLEGEMGHENQGGIRFVESGIHLWWVFKYCQEFQRIQKSQWKLCFCYVVICCESSDFCRMIWTGDVLFDLLRVFLNFVLFLFLDDSFIVVVFLFWMCLKFAFLVFYLFTVFFGLSCYEDVAQYRCLPLVIYVVLPHPGKVQEAYHFY